LDFFPQNIVNFVVLKKKTLSCIRPTPFRHQVVKVLEKEHYLCMGAIHNQKFIHIQDEVLGFVIL
jgi:hypothetical protein